MNRKEVFGEIEHTLGLVPTMFKAMPETSLELEWKLFKKIQLEESAIPPKMREFIGIGVAGATKCRYCSLFHTEVAKLHGATAAEIEDANHYAKSSAGWSAYINGMQIDYEQFKRETQQIIEHVRKNR